MHNFLDPSSLSTWHSPNFTSQRLLASRHLCHSSSPPPNVIPHGTVFSLSRWSSATPTAPPYQISGPSTCTTDTSYSYNSSCSSVFCPTTEATTQATILRTTLSAGGSGGCTREGEAASLTAWQHKSGSASRTSLGPISAAIAPDTVTASLTSTPTAVLLNAPAGPSSITTALTTAEVARTRTAHLQDQHPVHTPTSLAYVSRPEARCY